MIFWECGEEGHGFRGDLKTAHVDGDIGMGLRAEVHTAICSQMWVFGRKDCFDLFYSFFIVLFV